MLPEKIKSLRISRKWTIQKLADKAGVKKSSISKYENGDAVPREGVLRELAKAFGVSVSELVDESKPVQNLSTIYDPKLFERVMEEVRSLDEESKTIYAMIGIQFLEKKKYRDMVDMARENLS